MSLYSNVGIWHTVINQMPFFLHRMEAYMPIKLFTVRTILINIHIHALTKC
ncbi:protein of unknown function [Candidatus Nitrosocosmicus franklandus]|uniref:Uncharacterized protein n=1 Tax=Candidatus Nitrosocosmicus franklandianus TaxID=1798806 RepID=A0A484IFH5_9ARCH|nr:protein of unknown function [Candidatus Nitrosocosmicus franklandus]